MLLNIKQDLDFRITEYELIRFFIRLSLALTATIFLLGIAQAETGSDRLAKIGKNFAEALKFADAKLWLKAEKVAQKSQSDVAEDIIRWLKLRNGSTNFSEYELFLSVNSDWPGIKLLRKKGEFAIDDSVSNIRIKNYFSDIAPSTGHGALKLAQAYMSDGDYEFAEQVIIKSWY